MASVEVITIDQYINYALLPAFALIPVLGFFIILSEDS